MSEGDPFNLARAKALITYADLERMLGRLFTKLLGTDEAKAFIIFSKIIQHRTRRELLSELTTQTYGDQYKEFFNTLMNQQEKIDNTRNKVVHWIVETSHRGSEPVDPETDVNLHHPHLHDRTPFTKKEIEAFTERTEFMRRLVYSFVVHLKHGSAMDAEWRKVFQQPVRYPPPSDHPALRMFEGIERYEPFDGL
jgi:hypothetical protein